MKAKRLVTKENHCSFAYFTDACGGMIDASNGTISSPSFPDLYPANKNCIWEILAPPQWRITVNFTHFEIEGNNVRKPVVKTRVLSSSRSTTSEIPRMSI